MTISSKSMMISITGIHSGIFPAAAKQHVTNAAKTSKSETVKITSVLQETGQRTGVDDRCPCPLTPDV
jgi:hypothetical protein